MNDLNTTLDRWLQAEAEAGDAKAGVTDSGCGEPIAESALMAMFRALPVIEPTAGFADRVVRCAVRGTAAARDLGTLSRLLTAFGLLVTGACSMWLLPAAWVILGHIEGRSLPLIASRLVARVAQALGGLLGFGSWVSDFFHAVRLAASSPRTLAACVLAILFSILVIQALHRLLTTTRSSAHVASH